MTTKQAIDMEEVLRSKLPHGSGIDGDWTVFWEPGSGHGRWVCENAYHVMNDRGFYVGWAPFHLIIPQDNPLEFRLSFVGPNRWMARYYHLRDFLEDEFYWALEEIFGKVTT